MPSLTAELGRGSALSATSVTTSSVTPGAAGVLFLSATVRRFGGAAHTLTPSGVAASWELVEYRVSVSDQQIRQGLWVGRGPFTSGAVTIAASESLPVVLATVWGLTDVDPADPIDAHQGASSGADSNAPAVTVTPSQAGTLVLGFGGSRISDLTSPGSGYATRLSGFTAGTSGEQVWTWGMERTDTAPAPGAATTVNGTLGGNREWHIFGTAWAPTGTAPEEPPAASPWSVWDDSSEVSLALDGVWDGSAILPVTFDTVTS